MRGLVCCLVRGRGCCAVYSDGACNSGQGIAGGWLFEGLYLSGRASLASQFTGAEASELLGIVGALLGAFDMAPYYNEIVCCIDSQNAVDHVFGYKQPVYTDGWDLMPAIQLCRMLFTRLRLARCRVVSGRSIPKNIHLPHQIAHHEQRRRYDRDWLAADDVYHPIPVCFMEVFKLVARNRGSGHKSYEVPDEVREEVHRIGS